MRRLLIALVAFLALSVSVAHARERYVGYCEQGGHTATTGGIASAEFFQESYPTCTITVYLTGTATLASLYSDNAGTTKGNPFTASATGLFFFYADNGRYDVQESGAGIAPTFAIGDRLLNDPALLTTTVTNISYVATPVFDASVSSTFKITLTGNVTSSTLINVSAGQILYFIVCQDGAGAHTFVWPTNTVGAKTVDPTASACTTQTFIYDTVAVMARMLYAYTAKSVVSSQFLTGVTTDGIFSAAQPASTDLSDNSLLVKNNQSNTYTTGAQNFGAATSLKVPFGAGLQPTTSALIAYDTTANRFGGGHNGTYAVFVTPASTDTLTNKTYDAEGTGNVFTIPSKIWLPMGACDNTTAGTLWDLPTTNAAAAACVTGTNTQKGVLDFADGGNSLSSQMTLQLPSDWSGSVDVKFVWFSATTTGAVVWQIATSCSAAGVTDDTAFNTANTVTSNAAGSANQLTMPTISAITTTGCTAGSVLHLKVFRDPTNGSDTMAGTARLIGTELTWRRAI